VSSAKSLSKCKHVHFGPETNATYKMEEKNITKSDEEKDLGITIDGKLKASIQNYFLFTVCQKVLDQS
jgi:hypothetical protein